MEPLFVDPFPKGRKILYIDLETTGTNVKDNGIVQIAGIVEIDGKVEEEFNYDVNVFPDDQIVGQALEVNGKTREDIAGYPEPDIVYNKLKTVLRKYVDPFKKRKIFADKFYPAGFRVDFDIEFLDQWFRKNNDVYFGSWQNWHFIDALPELYKMELKGQITLENYKLLTVCNHFCIKIDAHDALSDIRATRALIHEIVI